MTSPHAMINKVEEGKTYSKINNIHGRKDKWLGLVRVYERLVQTLSHKCKGVAKMTENTLHKVLGI